MAHLRLLQEHDEGLFILDIYEIAEGKRKGGIVSSIGQVTTFSLHLPLASQPEFVS